MSFQTKLAVNVVYTTFSRTESLIKSVENVLAELPCSKIYIYSDSWPIGNDTTEYLINNHRNNITNHFKGNPNIMIIKRPKNLGMLNAIHSIKAHLGLKPVLFLEDDIIPLNGFGQFLEMVCSKFSNDPWVTTASLFNPLSLFNSFHRPLRITRISMYGTLLWPNKIDLIRRISQAEVSLVKNNNSLMARMLATLSPEGFNFSLIDYYSKNFNALDCRLTFRQALYGTHGIVPQVSLIENLGLSGDGTNCPDSPRLRKIFHKNINNSGIAYDLALQPYEYNLSKDIDAAHVTLLDPKTGSCPDYSGCSLWSDYVESHLQSRFHFKRQRLYGKIRSVFPN